MKFEILGLLAMGLLGATSANANVLRLDATSTDLESHGDFFVVFDDAGDGLLQAEEITSFSGLLVISAAFTDVLEAVPTIADISSDSGAFCVPENAWCFSVSEDGQTFTFPTSDFTYTITVPEGGTLGLLGLGLAGLGFARRRHFGSR